MSDGNKATYIAGAIAAGILAGMFIDTVTSLAANATLESQGIDTAPITEPVVQQADNFNR